MCGLVGRADNNVTLRASLIRHGKTRSCRHSHSMSNDLNAAVAYERGSLRASSQALSAALHSLDQSAGSGLGPHGGPEGVQYRDVLHPLATASPALVRLAHRACELAERYIIIRTAH